MFQKAKKTKTYMRIFISGVSGSGKTYSALRLAKGIVSKSKGDICVIDTEHGKSAMNSEWVDFKISIIDSPFIVEDYTKEIKEAIDKCDVLIIDSISHAWKNVLARVNELVKMNPKMSYVAWGKKNEGTDLQDSFVETLLGFPGHLICTCRAKQENAMRNVNGKNVIVKMGMGNVQRDGIEYEFDINFEAVEDAGITHEFFVAKNRTSYEFEDNVFIDEEFGVNLFKWYDAPKGEYQVSDLPEIKELKGNIAVGSKMLIAKSNQETFDEISTDVFGTSKWEISKNHNLLSDLLDKLRMKFKSLK